MDRLPVTLVNEDCDEVPNWVRCMGNGNYVEAARLLNVLLQEKPNNPDYRFGLGMCHSYIGSYDQSLREIEKYITLEPEYYQGYYYRGVILMEISNPFAKREGNKIRDLLFAIKSFRKSISLLDRNEIDDEQKDEKRMETIMGMDRKTIWARKKARIYDRIGNCYNRLGNYDKAIEHHSISISFDPCTLFYEHRAYCYNFYPDLYGREDYFLKAAEDYTQAIKCSVGEVDEYQLYYYRGMSYFKRGKYEEAAEDFKKCLELFKTERDDDTMSKASIYSQMFMLYMRMRKMKGCLSSISNAIRLDPENPKYYFSRAVLLSSREYGFRKYQKALEDCRNGKKFETQEPEKFHLLMGRIFCLMGDCERSIGCLTKPLKRKKQFELFTLQSLIERGKSYLEIGNYENAFRDFQTVDGGFSPREIDIIGSFCNFICYRVENVGKCFFRINSFTKFVGRLKSSISNASNYSKKRQVVEHNIGFAVFKFYRSCKDFELAYRKLSELFRGGFFKEKDDIYFFHFESAKLLSEICEYDSAMNHLERILSIPDFSISSLRNKKTRSRYHFPVLDVLLLKIQLFKKMGDFKRCFDLLEILFTRYTDDPTFHYTRGKCYLRTDEKLKAIDEFTIAMKEVSLLEKRGKEDTDYAESKFRILWEIRRRSLRLSGMDNALVMMYQSFFAIDKEKGADQYVESMKSLRNVVHSTKVENDGVSFDTKSNLLQKLFLSRGKTFYSLGNYPHAVLDFCYSLRKKLDGTSFSVEDQKVVLLLSHSLLKMNRLQEAEFIIREIGLKLFPESSELVFLRGTIYEERGLINRAIESFSTCSLLKSKRKGREICGVSYGMSTLTPILPGGSSVRTGAHSARTYEKMIRKSDSGLDLGRSKENVENEEFESQLRLRRKDEDEEIETADRWIPFRSFKLKNDENEVKREGEILETLKISLGNCTMDGFEKIERIGLQSRKEGKSNHFFGCFCGVIKCRRMETDELFVLKVLRPGEETKLKKILEKDTVEISFHPNVIQVLYSFWDVIDFEKYGIERILSPNPETLATKIHRTAIIVMKYCFKNLRQYMSQRGSEKLEILEFLGMIKQILEGTIHLHSHNIVHRDLKLDNIFIDELEQRLIIGDLGACYKFSDSESNFAIQYDELKLRSLYNSLGGSPQYQSPEIRKYTYSWGNRRKRVIPADSIIDFSKYDIFSIGVIAYHLLTGEYPYPRYPSRTKEESEGEEEDSDESSDETWEEDLSNSADCEYRNLDSSSEEEEEEEEEESGFREVYTQDDFMDINPSFSIPEDIRQFVKNMLLCDMKKRITAFSAYDECMKLLELYHSKENTEGEEENGIKDDPNISSLLFCCCCQKYLKEKRKNCSRCHTVCYCDEDCQRKDWKEHKLVCKSLSYLRENDRSSSTAKGKAKSKK